jgi:hypothetical protein
MRLRGLLVTRVRAVCRLRGVPRSQEHVGLVRVFGPHSDCDEPQICSSTARTRVTWWRASGPPPRCPRKASAAHHNRSRQDRIPDGVARCASVEASTQRRRRGSDDGPVGRSPPSRPIRRSSAIRPGSRARARTCAARRSELGSTARRRTIRGRLRARAVAPVLGCRDQAICSHARPSVQSGSGRCGNSTRRRRAHSFGDTMRRWPGRLREMRPPLERSRLSVRELPARVGARLAARRLGTAQRRCPRASPTSADRSKNLALGRSAAAPL